MFSFIIKSWRGRPLTSYEVIVDLVGAAPATTTTTTGLRILAEWNQADYPTGIQVGEAELAALSIRGHDWHPEWNDEITPDLSRKRSNRK